MTPVPKVPIIASLLLCSALAACRQAPDSESQQPNHNSNVSQTRTKQPQPTQSNKIAPGTILTQDQLKPMLQVCGTPWIVVQVFQETCGPCLTEALRLTDIRDTWRKKGISIVGLGIDPTVEETRRFSEHTGGRITYPLYHAPWFARQHEIEATPTLFLFRSDGRLVARVDPLRTDGDLLKAIETAVQGNK